MVELVVSPQANSDMQEIGDYISHELHNPSTALRLIQRFRESMLSLRQFPEMGSPLQAVNKPDALYRYLICGNYLIFYHVGTKAVHIDRVLYGRRDYMALLFDEQFSEEE